MPIDKTFIHGYTLEEIEVRCIGGFCFMMYCVFLAQGIRQELANANCFNGEENEIFGF